MTYKPGELTKIADRARKKSDDDYENGSPEDITEWHNVTEISGLPTVFTVKMVGGEVDSPLSRGLHITESKITSLEQREDGVIFIKFWDNPISIYQREINGKVVLTDNKYTGNPVR